MNTIFTDGTSPLLCTPLSNSFHLSASPPTSLPCKLCAEPSPHFGAIDFHKSCEEARGKLLALSGIAVDYYRCQNCGFVFTATFDRWGIEDFRHAIYNSDYPLVDPDCIQIRPEGNARLVAGTFSASRESICILDYGGGSGLLAERLRDEGFAAQTYDPFSKWNELPNEQFDLITAFEVLEHLPQPSETTRSMAALLKPFGGILFSTLLQPSDFSEQGLRWWYAAPRNGHISLYTAAALEALFHPLGMRVASFNPGLHIAYREKPPFAQHLQLPD